MVLSNTRPRDDEGVSIVVLAFNEAETLTAVVDSIHRAVSGRIPKYEIIIVNDGSTDKTGQVAVELGLKDPLVIAAHNPGNMGCGYTFRHGVRLARFRYVWLVPGDGEITQAALETIADAIGSADMILPYMKNSRIRPLLRQAVSWGYTSLLNVLFLKNIRYYNGPGVFPTLQVLNTPEVHSPGFAFTAPLILHLLKNGCTCRQIGIELRLRQYGKPSFAIIWNVFSALKILLRLVPEIYFGEKRGISNGTFEKIRVKEKKRGSADA